MAVADYVDYIDHMRTASISLRELASQDRIANSYLLEIADRLNSIAERLSPTTGYTPVSPLHNEGVV